ncbi:MAG TPA: MerR family transcriptional regulator [Pseudonocardiaceae bacterium]|jgi:DNA-binding transcriptional MerR regulator|nr:MerR family transcriptional regulator [Pseudonocardiaceae bacterium]
MLRIGEVAELVGVSTRTIRHYHQIGLLREPVRMANGYRGYEPWDVVLLLRIRRMVETGLHLDEIANVLAADRGREPRDILIELDADLADQERRIRTRRKRIAELLANQDASTYSVELAALLTNLERTEADQPTLDRQRIAARMFDALAGELSSRGAYSTAITDRPLATQMAQLSRSFHQLAGRPPTDPAIADLARRAANLGPAILARTPEPAKPVPPQPVAPAVLAHLATTDPAQARCWRLLLEYLYGLA